MSNPSEILREALEQILALGLNSDTKPMHAIANDAYEAHCIARRALEGRPSLEPADQPEIERQGQSYVLRGDTAKRFQAMMDETERSKTAAQRPAGEDRADAERYRWLRQYGVTNSWGKDLHPRLRGPELDALIDAAITDTQRSSSGARSDETETGKGST